MIIAGHSGVYSINQLTETELNIMLAIVHTVNARCFDTPDDDGTWYSNDDFILTLTDEQRAVLAKVGDEIELIYSE